MVRLLLFALFFYSASCGSLPGRAYYQLAGFEATLESPYRAMFVPAIVLGLLILLWRYASGDLAGARVRSDVPAHRFQPPLLLWFLAATVSMLFTHPGLDAWLNYIGAFVAGFVVYVALRGIVVDQNLYVGVITSMVVGALFPLVLGLYAFYQVWGVPSLSTLVMARFTPTLLAGYMHETFGNVNSTAAYLMLVYPPVLSLALCRRLSLPLRLVFFGSVLLCFVHLAITQTRAAVVVAGLVTVLIVALRRSERVILPLLVMGGILAVPLGLAGLESLGFVSGRYVSAARLEKSDQSVYERLESMGIGCDMFEEHPLVGLGLGEMLTQHPYHSTHQFNIQQAAELGVTGLVSSTWLALLMVASLLWPLRRSIDEETKMRWTLLCGPATFVLYAVTSNVPLANGVTNPWAILFVGFTCLAENPICLSPPCDAAERGLSAS